MENERPTPLVDDTEGTRAKLESWFSERRGTADHYDYYLVFAGMRYGLILSRIMYATGQDEQVKGNFAVQLLQKYLDRLAQS